MTYFRMMREDSWVERGWFQTQGPNLYSKTPIRNCRTYSRSCRRFTDRSMAASVSPAHISKPSLDCQGTVGLPGTNPWALASRSTTVAPASQNLLFPRALLSARHQQRHQRRKRKLSRREQRWRAGEWPKHERKHEFWQNGFNQYSSIHGFNQYSSIQRKNEGWSKLCRR